MKKPRAVILMLREQLREESERAPWTPIVVSPCCAVQGLEYQPLSRSGLAFSLSLLENKMGMKLLQDIFSNHFFCFIFIARLQVKINGSIILILSDKKHKTSWKQHDHGIALAFDSKVIKS